MVLFSFSALCEELQISLQPSSVVLGSGETVSVLVRLPRRDALLRQATSAGMLVPAAEPGGSERRFTWTPPSTQIPTTALLLFWTEERGAPPKVSLARLALVGRTSLDIQTEPLALVRVQVSNVIFGPNRADKHGRVQVSVEVPPGVQAAQVLAESQGRTTSRTVALGVPATSKLFAAISPNRPADDEPCWLILAHPDALEPRQVHLELSGGQAELEASAPTRALYRITPQRGAREIAATASLPSGESARVSARTASADEASVEGPIFAAHRFSASASAGGFYAGGANAGAALAIDGSYALPAAAGRFALELELGYRSASLSSPVAGLGFVHSTLSALSIELALRALAFQRGRWSVYGRLGGGVLPFNVSAHSDFQPPFTQTAVAVEAFAAAQVGYRLRPLELFGELRGGIAPAHTSTVDAQLGGVLFALGARYPIP